MNTKKGKRSSESAVESHYLLMPQHANPYGTAFGGVIVAWMDMVAAMAAQKHCGREVVTASIDSLSFLEPVRIGDHVILKAAVNYTGRTSMEVEVKVWTEAAEGGKKTIATTAYLTFVALDENKRPALVPALKTITKEEKKRFEEGKRRAAARKRERAMR